MGGTELKTDSLKRWVMYSKDTYGSGRIFLTREQKQAVEEGKKYSQRPYADVWAKDAASNLAETTTPLGDAQVFEYQPDALSDDVEELAKSTMNERYAAKMLGYDMDTYGGMIHALKHEYSLRGDDNVTFHDSGDVYFNGEWLDNIHTYAL